MRMPKVSVIIPVYNAQDYLKECIESVLKQTLKEFEIICIDDGSADNSYSILKNFAKTDDRFVLFSQTNQGVSAARNVGIENAKGEYVYFLDSDDYIEPELLEFVCNEMDSKSLDVIYFDAYAFGEEGIAQQLIDEKNKYYSVKCDYNAIYTGKELLCKMRSNYDYSCPVWKQVIRRSFLLDNQIRFYQGIIHEDELYTIQTMMHAQRVEYVNKVFYHRRLRTDSIMTRPVSFESVYGYFVCIKEAYKFLLQNKCNQNEYSSLFGLLKSFSVSARNQYGKLPESEQRKRTLLCEEEKFLFNLYVADSLDVIKQRDKVIAEKQNLVRDRDIVTGQLAKAEQKVTVLEQDKTNVTRKLVELGERYAKAEKERVAVAGKLTEAERKAIVLEQGKADVGRKLTELEEKYAKAEKERVAVAVKLTEAERKAIALEQDKTNIARKLTELEEKYAKAEKEIATVAGKLTEAERKATVLEQDKTNIARKLTELEEKYAKAEKEIAAVAGKLTEAEQKVAALEQDKTNVGRKLTEVETILEQERKVAYKQLSEMSVKLVTAEEDLLQERKIYFKKLTELQNSKVTNQVK